MLTTTLLAVVATFGYAYVPSKSCDYDVEYAFDGFIPALGGIEGKVKVILGIQTIGISKDEIADQKFNYDLKSFRFYVENDEMPYGIDKVKPYFPKTTVWISERGEVKKTNAISLPFPVRLPGMDQKRFPESSFLMLQFPSTDLIEGSKWTYTRSFGDSSMTYNAVANKITDETIEASLKIKQSYDVFEDESKSVVAKQTDAIAKVHTEMSGGGTILFDRKLGVVRSIKMETNSVSDSTDLKSKVKTRRKLKMNTTVTLRGKDSVPWKTD